MKTILLVDDEPGVLKILNDTLVRFGYKVIPQPDAGSDLTVIREGAKIDLVITDNNMPGMNGSEFVTVLKQALPSVPVIMLTGYGSVESYLKSLSNGVFEYINKPVQARELDRIVKAALDASDAGQPPLPS